MGKITTTLRQSAIPANPQDIACIGMAIGPCSAGPLNAPTTISQLSDLDQFGNGPGVRLAAAMLMKGGAPVFLTRSETTSAGSLGSVTKTSTPSSTTLYGGLLITGGGADGEVFVTRKVSTAVSIRLVDPGAMGAALSSSYASGVITVSLATNGMGAITTTGTQLTTELNTNQSTYVSAVAQGTGASAVTAFAQTAIGDDSNISYTPRRAGVTVAHVASGNNTSLGVTTSTLAITVALATDGNGTPTSTAAQVRTAVLADPEASAYVSDVSYSGAGSDVAGIWSAQALVYGDTSAMTASGTPRDGGRIRVQCTRSGTVGTQPYPKIRWSWDDGLYSWSAEKIVPATGIVALSDSTFTSGVSVTFTGVLTEDNEWYFSATEPESSSTAMLTAAQAAIDNADNVERDWGFLATMTPCSASVFGSLNTKLQTALQGPRKPYGYCPTRGIALGGGDSDETESEWRASVEADFAGTESSRGLLSAVAGYAEHVDPLTLRQYKTPLLLSAVARRVSIPMHENLGRVASGPITDLGTVYGEKLVQGASVNGGYRLYARDERVAVKVVVSGNDTPFDLDVTDNLVTVTCATDSSGVCLTTASQLVGALMGSADAVALLRAEYTGTGATVVSALSETVLTALPVDHDERTQIGLGERFIVATTHEEHPGAIYFDGSQSQAADGDSDYATTEKVSVILAAARVAHDRLFDFLNDNVPTIGAAESATVPQGAITQLGAAKIERTVGTAIEALLFSEKSDGRKSASPYPDGVKPFTVKRNYSLASTNQLRGTVAVNLLGLIRTIDINAGGLPASEE